jgi:stage II sporulation protein AB (anti-sigma F factor)
MSENPGSKVLNFMNMEFLSVPENIGLSRVVVASFAAQLDMTLNDMEEMKVATSEAVSNCIIHGYNNQPVGKVWLSITLFDNRLEIMIKDEGIGIEDIEQAMEPAFSTDPERMGLGFVFMKSFMDQVHVESEVGKGTAVTLIKDYPSGNLQAGR